jgi:signal transduction histidine kinase
LSSYENTLLEFNDKTKKESTALLKRAKQKLAIQELRKEFIKNYNLYRSELEGSIYNNKQELNKKINSIFTEFDERTGMIQSDLDYQKNKSLLEINTKEDIIEEIDKIKEKFEFLREQLDKEIFPLVKHISRLEFGFDEELIQGAYRTEYEKIKYQWEQTRETAQLGVAVEIIDHEFNVLYSQINTCLKKLNNELGKTATSTYEHLKTLFSQLEDKYELLSPLYRISGVTPKKIVGTSIVEYLHDFFEKTLKEEKIELQASRDFEKHFITIKEPVIHTVYINIVNNAIYWLREVENKKITLDYLPKTDEILILNSGPTIPEHRLDKIFELFYSNRPNGRGIGLYLAKQSLEENYFDIYATNDKKYNKLGGACFVLKPLN